MILDNVKSIEFDKNLNHIFGIKSGILWAHSKDGSGTFPLLYISKPKNISREDFEALLERISITVYRDPICQILKK